MGERTFCTEVGQQQSCPPSWGGCCPSPYYVNQFCYESVMKRTTKITKIPNAQAKLETESTAIQIPTN